MSREKDYYKEYVKNEIANRFINGCTMQHNSTTSPEYRKWLEVQIGWMRNKLKTDLNLEATAPSLTVAAPSSTAVQKAAAEEAERKSDALVKEILRDVSAIRVERGKIFGEMRLMHDYLSQMEQLYQALSAGSGDKAAIEQSIRGSTNMLNFGQFLARLNTEPDLAEAQIKSLDAAIGKTEEYKKWFSQLLRKEIKLWARVPVIEAFIARTGADSEALQTQLDNLQTDRNNIKVIRQKLDGIKNQIAGELGRYKPEDDTNAAFRALKKIRAFFGGVPMGNLEPFGDRTLVGYRDDELNELDEAEEVAKNIAQIINRLNGRVKDAVVASASF